MPEYVALVAEASSLAGGNTDIYNAIMNAVALDATNFYKNNDSLASAMNGLAYNTNSLIGTIVTETGVDSGGIDGTLGHDIKNYADSTVTC